MDTLKTVNRHVVLGLVIAAVAFCGALFSAPQKAFAVDESGQASRAIAIAYDNSGSMGGGTSKWCGAKYSIEVLSSMLDPKDTMVLYAMDSRGQKLAVKGSDNIDKRVSTVHDAVFGESDYTDPAAAIEAYRYLMKQSADEKYLVITSDGIFNKGNGLADVERVAQDCAKNGITVVYLAIGDMGGEVEYIDSDPDRNIFVKNAPADDILPTMNDVANLIFGRAALPEADINSEAGTINFQIPMGKVIVFAQGENVSVGDLTLSDGAVVKGEKANVKYSAKPKKAKWGPYEIDPTLQGVVATYTGDMVKGECTIDIQNASTVEVYYAPKVGIEIGLLDADGIAWDMKPGEDNELSAGEYEVTYSYTDPFTGERLESELLEPSTFGLVLESGGEITKIPEGNPLIIKKGKASISANASAECGVRVSQSYRGVDVSAALTPLVIDAKGIAPAMVAGELGKKAYDVAITKEDGSEFTAAEWEALEVTATDESGIEWTLEKNEVPGSVAVTPQLIGGDSWETQESLCGPTGVDSTKAVVTFDAYLDSGNDIYKGSAEKSVKYTGDAMKALVHHLPCLIALLILLYFIYKYLTKPRLPRKMRPNISFASGKRGETRCVPLRYNDKMIKNKWSPWGPETVEISFNPSSFDDSDVNFGDRIGFWGIDLVAAKKEKGARRFVYGDKTIQTLANYQQEHSGFPDPSFRGITIPKSGVSSASAGKKGKFSKKGKSTQASKSIGTFIEFDGREPSFGGGRKAKKSVSYKLKFKLVNR